MKESVRTALGWIRSNVDIIEGIDNTDKTKKDLFEEIDIFVHFPAAAIPKDGPSAGITIATALVFIIKIAKL